MHTQISPGKCVPRAISSRTNAITITLLAYDLEHANNALYYYAFEHAKYTHARAGPRQVIYLAPPGAVPFSRHAGEPLALMPIWSIDVCSVADRVTLGPEHSSSTARGHGQVIYGSNSCHPRQAVPICMCQYRTTGYGTGSGKFNYASEARKILSNSVIETGVLRVLGGWSVRMFRLCWCKRRCTTVPYLQGCSVILMACTGTPAARGLGVYYSRVTWAAVLSYRSIGRERCTPIACHTIHLVRQ